MSVDISQLKQSSHQARAVFHGVGIFISPIGKNTDHHKQLYRLWQQCSLSKKKTLKEQSSQLTSLKILGDRNLETALFPTDSVKCKVLFWCWKLEPSAFTGRKGSWGRLRHFWERRAASWGPRLEDPPQPRSFYCWALIPESFLLPFTALSLHNSVLSCGSSCPFLGDSFPKKCSMTLSGIPQVSEALTRSFLILPLSLLYQEIIFMQEFIINRF